MLATGWSATGKGVDGCGRTGRLPHMMSHGFSQLEQWPVGLLDVRAEELHRLISGPTLIHLAGREPQPLFVSVLLHGNETTGLGAIQALLRKYAGKTLPRSVSVFVGNVLAAREGLRRLDEQPDFNRIWPGTERAPGAETRMAQAVHEEMSKRGVFASIDVHNNTGLNPHYACVHRLDSRSLKLASMFGRLVIYSTTPRGTQTGAFADLCPAVTLECGKPGQAYGVEHAFRFIDSCLHLTSIPEHPPAEHDLDLFHTVAQVMVREDVRFSYSDTTADLLLCGQLDHLNFTELRAGTILGYVSHAAPKAMLPLVVRDEDGQDVASRYFAVDDGRLVLKRPTMPAMLTLDERIIRQDCLCYLMERLAR
jgi:succinylglutamate desuccinylase